MIKFEKDVCQDFIQSSSREWLETNGIGGFSSSTISGANTRRYHALLTPATQPPLGRVTMLSKFEGMVTIDGQVFELSANQFPGVVHPDGFKYLTSFRLDPFPVWTFEVGGIEIEKKIFMVYGANTTVCRWSVVDEKPMTAKVTLELKPLLSFCDYHHLQHEDANFDVHYETTEYLIKVHPYGQMPPLYLAHNAVAVDQTGYWYRNFEYAIEKERGFDFQEDLYQPFALRFDLTMPANVIASLEPIEIGAAVNLASAEAARRQRLLEDVRDKDDFTKLLVAAADQFIVARGEGQTVIAGYHWFSDWGRDTMIALPGLTLSTNRPEIARSILLEFSKNISEGMLPNRFPDAGEVPEYNTVDATLWYFEAIRAYVEKTGDFQFVRDNLYEKLVNIIDWHLHGTRYNIHVDTDGLLYAGVDGVQLTWMDAKIGDLVITPRIGKPVEIQALWYNALMVMADFAGKFNDSDHKEKFEAMAQAARQSFNANFWNEADQCLYDVITSEGPNLQIRPNQIFAVGLPNAILDDPERSKKVVEKVEAELLTPVGLRSLAPSDPQYCPIYIGSPFDRDSAYHQGTVWGWLIGGFVDARRRVFPDEEEKIDEILSGFEAHLNEAGIGQISEIFDAEPPHAPRGCIAQAWSVAEVLRVRLKS